MNIYFFASQATSEKNRQRQLLIKKTLEQSGAIVNSNLDTTPSVDPALHQAAAQGRMLLDEMDALVIEGTSGDSEVGYLLAYAISAKKPTLYLMEKGSQTKNPLRYLPVKSIPSHIFIRTYHEPTVAPVIAELLRQVEQSEFAETPSIKFTLRITPLIERYLHWKTHNTKISKADFLRQLIIDEVIRKDEEYQKFHRHGK